MIVYDDDDMICDDEYDDLPVSDEIISPFSTDACTQSSTLQINSSISMHGI